MKNFSGTAVSILKIKQEYFGRGRKGTLPTWRKTNSFNSFLKNIKYKKL